ncbi:MAG: amino acid ABC transporter permease [Rhodospirillaceae bacterium]|nr:amino acid ABC transporter permease [Rhodospirillaceae bacterium]|tara:strand:+ start:3861 stop:5357 length:1497 start_codon:yes stop_codon:yes gene_type:complete
MILRSLNIALCLLSLLGFTTAFAKTDSITIGSKSFTESVILGEILGGLAKSTGRAVNHRKQLGGTRILWQALLRGEIDAYPEYTGTIIREILANEEISSGQALKRALNKRGLAISAPLGFNNTYALATTKKAAKKFGLSGISDLQRFAPLKFGFSNEFMDRGDGWPALRKRYQLPQTDVRGLNHDLAYRALQSGDIDVIDVYTTDAEIAYYNLQILSDDRAHFPRYDAVILYRSTLKQTAPDVVSAFLTLPGKLDGSRMSRMNAAVKIKGRNEGVVAAEFLTETYQLKTFVENQGIIARVLQRTFEHLVLVGISLFSAILVAIPLGIYAARHSRAGQVVLAFTGIIQTIPGLALLVFMIPLFGIGSEPAIAALFLFSLLPIVRNTHAGLNGIDPTLVKSAIAIGLPAPARLRRIELPLASPSIMAGIKTSAVINIGTATLGALIGAGGYGQPILTGIRLDNIGLILEGAIPAAVMALAVQFSFELAERRLNITARDEA